jgi:sulfide:quinone oxidoreductase
MTQPPAKPHVLVLGGNFAGLASAQQVRDFCGDKVDITLIERRDHLLFVPNIPADVFDNRDPAGGQIMPLHPVLKRDDIAFIQGEVAGIDLDQREVRFTPNERPGAEIETVTYDFLVVAVGVRLAYDRIEGFAEHGHTVSDIYHGQRLRAYLHGGGYKGGPIVIGSARFHQGDGARGLSPYPGGSIPTAEAACEGPPLEITMSMATWLTQHKRGAPDLITVFTPAETIAEDAGLNTVKTFLGLAAGMGIHYKNKVRDVRRLTAESIEFANGDSLEAELKIVLPDWRPHDFIRALPIADSEGFIVTDLLMRSPKYPNVFAAGDCAAVTVPKIGGIGHQEAEIVGRQVARDIGAMPPEEADRPLQPVVFCIGDMGGGKAFYIRSISWFGGPDEVLKLGRVPYQLKMRYRDMFFLNHGRVPDFGLQLAQFAAEALPL